MAPAPTRLPTPRPGFARRPASRSSPSRVNANTRATLEARHLRDDVSRGAEPVQTEALGLPGQAQGAVPDQPCAQQRRHLQVADTRRGARTRSGIGHHPLGIAAIDVPPGEARALAQVLAAASAIAALPAGPPQPRHPDAGADRRRLDPSAPGSPCSVTVATIWWPGMIGSAGMSTSPSSRCRSVRQTPHACTRASNWPGRRAGRRPLGGLQHSDPLDLHREHAMMIAPRRGIRADPVPRRRGLQRWAGSPGGSTASTNRSTARSALGAGMRVRAQIGDPGVEQHVLAQQRLPGVLAARTGDHGIRCIGVHLGAARACHRGIAAEQVLHRRGGDERARPQRVGGDPVVARNSAAKPRAHIVIPNFASV